MLVLDTPLGAVHIALLAVEAPLTVAHVRHVIPSLGQGTFYRAQRSEHRAPGREFEVLQGGWMLSTPTVAHEYSVPHGLGTVSLARLGPGTAAAEFFICMTDQAPDLDAGADPPMDGLGFAVFGRVIEGLDIARTIHSAPTVDDAPAEFLRGQWLDDPVPFTAVLH